MLAMTRGINFFNNRLQRREGPWSYMPGTPLHRLRGRVFAIIGLGRIGSAAALRQGAGHGCRVLRSLQAGWLRQALGIRRVDTLDVLLGQAFILSVHCPLTPETRNIVDARAIGLMPKGSYLVNTAARETVDATAIPDAIRSGRLAGAAIDVLPHDRHPMITHCFRRARFS